jgi:septum site-determining protein MinD
MGKVITVISGKGGVGKTVSAINLAASLNKFNKNVILVDCNFTTPNTALHLGSPIVPITLNHVLSGKRKVYDAVYQHYSGLKLVASSISLKALKGINLEKLPRALKDLKKISDIIVLDAAAGLGKEALVALENSDDVVVVTNPEMPAVTDALKTIRLAEQLNKNVLGVLVTKVRRDNKEMKLREISNLLEKPIIGVIPEDNHVRESVMIRDAVIHLKPRSKASVNYKKIAAKLIGKEYKEPSFFSNLFSPSKKE